MRNATVYGVSPRLRLDVVLNNLVAWAHTTGAIRLQSDGSSWRPLVHVRGVARARLSSDRRARRPRARPSLQTSARPRRTIAFATSPRSFTTGCRTARSPSQRVRRPIPEATASISRSSNRRSRSADSSGRPSAVRTSWRERTRKSDSPSRISRGTATSGSRSSSGCSHTRAFENELRRGRGA
jgi:hypothetical protein